MKSAKTNPMLATCRPNPARTYLAALCLLLCLVAPTLSHGEDSEETLDLFNAWQNEPATASRAPKPLSHTAENITIVTAAEIEALNAHTLGDVLETVSGIQTVRTGGPGSATYTQVQSSNFNHVLVMVDGIPINTGDNFSDVALVPAQIIERVEIIKGAASSSWGQALGGPINVITKAPLKDRTLGGSVTASMGDGRRGGPRPNFPAQPTGSGTTCPAVSSGPTAFNLTQDSPPITPMPSSPMIFLAKGSCGERSAMPAPAEEIFNRLSLDSKLTPESGN